MYLDNSSLKYMAHLYAAILRLSEQVETLLAVWLTEAKALISNNDCL